MVFKALYKGRFRFRSNLKLTSWRYGFRLVGSDSQEINKTNKTQPQKYFITQISKRYNGKIEQKLPIFALNPRKNYAGHSCS